MILSILKNFSTINPNIAFDIQQGLIATVSEKNTILARYDFDDSDTTFSEGRYTLYDLPQFLNVISLFNNPRVSIVDDATPYCVIESGDEGNEHKIKYYLSAENLLKLPKKDTLNIENVIGRVQITADTIKHISKTSAAMQLTHMKLHSDGKEQFLTLCNPESSTENVSTISLGENGDQTKYSVYLDAKTFCPMMADYHITISEQFIRLETSDNNLSYWFATSTIE